MTHTPTGELHWRLLADTSLIFHRWDPQERRNYGEPVHEDNDILGIFSPEVYTHFTPGWGGVLLVRSSEYQRNFASDLFDRALLLVQLVFLWPWSTNTTLTGYVYPYLKSPLMLISRSRQLRAISRVVSKQSSADRKPHAQGVLRTITHHWTDHLCKSPFGERLVYTIPFVLCEPNVRNLATPKILHLPCSPGCLEPLIGRLGILSSSYELAGMLALRISRDNIVAEHAHLL